MRKPGNPRSSDEFGCPKHKLLKCRNRGYTLGSKNNSRNRSLQINRSKSTCTYITLTHKSKLESIQTSVHKQEKASFPRDVTPVWLQHLCSTECTTGLRCGENYRTFFHKRMLVLCQSIQHQGIPCLIDSLVDW